MPSRIAHHKKSVTISIPKILVVKIDLIAKLTNRSRTYIIEHIIRSQIDLKEEGDHILTDMQVLEVAKKLNSSK